jgi:RNase P/RNase MRP subunit POP5
MSGTSCCQTEARTGKRQSLIWVKSVPEVNDPREMKTILTFSLRSLWGDLESHSCDLSVEKVSNGDAGSRIDAGNSNLLVVRCRSDSVDAVRAALTLVTPPPYLEATLYQFDVVHIQEN